MNKKNIYCLSALTFYHPFILLATDYPRVQPKSPSYFEENKEKPSLNNESPNKTSEDKDEILIEHLKNIALVSHQSYDPHFSFKSSQEVEMIDLSLDEKNQQKLKQVLNDKFIHRPLSKETLSEIRACISNFYISVNRPVVLVELPEQDISEGHLIIVITESRLGSIHYIGNKAFKTSRYEKYMRLQPDRVIESDILLADLAWINQNPFRYATASLIAGDKAGTTDIDVYIKDQRPIRVYTGFDNTGFEETESHRYFAGFNWGNVFNSDQSFSYQFTASLDFKRFLAHTASYSAPLPWRHIVSVFGGYSEVHAPVNTSGTSHGQSGQASLRYEIPIKPDGLITQSIKWGADFKRLNNTLDFGGLTFANYASLFQLMLGYEMSLKKETYINSFDIGFFGAPGDWIPDMTDNRYSGLRQGARTLYLYARANFENIWFLPKGFELHSKAQAQASSSRLIPSEQYGLGGLYTVRGYRERVVNADDALFLSTEAHMPSLKLFKKGKAKLTGIAFADFGWGYNLSLTSSVAKENAQGQEKLASNVSYLLGVGPGLKFQVSDWLSFKGFFGYQALRLKEGDGERYRFSFSGFISF